MPFNTSTRLKYALAGTLTKPIGGGVVSLRLPPTGILQEILLGISITISGTLTAPNALGVATAIDRVTVSAGNGVTLFDVSGVGYQYLLREVLGDFRDPLPYDDGRAAVVVGTFELDMIIPIAMNSLDQLGLIMLQNEATVLTLTVRWATDTTLATGATVTGTCKVQTKSFEVPAKQEDWPNLEIAHQILEDQLAIPSTAEFPYYWAIGSGTYLGMYHLLPGGFTRVRLVVQESNTLEDLDVDTHRLRYADAAAKDPVLAGALSGYDKRVFFDMMGPDGQGAFGTLRDVIDGGALTSLKSLITPVAAQTLYAVRRLLMPLK